MKSDINEYKINFVIMNRPWRPHLRKNLSLLDPITDNNRPGDYQL